MEPNSSLRQSLNKLRRRLYRSDHGKIMGVFSGIAESLGYCASRTRLIGAAILLILASSLGAHGLWIHILVAGFFYLAIALLMQPPRKLGTAGQDQTEEDGSPVPPAVPFWKRSGGQAAVPSYQARRPAAAPRVDLQQLDQQLDGLDRRIQRMETIVTDRQYDWDRRMES